MLTKLLKLCALPAMGSQALGLTLAVLLALSAGYRPAVAPWQFQERQMSQ